MTDNENDLFSLVRYLLVAGKMVSEDLPALIGFNGLKGLNMPSGLLSRW